ncbi:MAG: MoaD/ThiS family protein [Treponema sp.]|jgi:adenylyltransferase/sulfurtransferase|nr:MoaD/ThiS family protein [Treponema sp.]
MSVTIQIPTALRPFTDGQREVVIDGTTAGTALTAFGERYPDIKRHLWNESAGGTRELRSFINVFVGETNIKKLQGLDTPLTDGSTLLLVPAIAGGAFFDRFMGGGGKWEK